VHLIATYVYIIDTIRTSGILGGMLYKYILIFGNESISQLRLMNKNPYVQQINFVNVRF